VTYPVGQAAQ
jgi:hypothetical protein